MQKPDGPWFWEIALPNGTYLVHIVAGEANNFDSTMRIKAESVLVVNGAPNTTTERFREGTALVTVADGRLTVAPSEADGAVNAKIAFMEITAVNKVTLAGTDPDGDALSFTVVSGPKNGSLVGTGKDLAYVPTVGFKGADSFTFKVGDGKLEVAQSAEEDAGPRPACQPHPAVDEAARCVVGQRCLLPPAGRIGKQQAGLQEHLKTVADPEHEPAAIAELHERIGEPGLEF